MLIAIDFDQTCVIDGYPGIGPDNPGAADWLRKWVDAGAQLILWTMRSLQLRAGCDPLTCAVQWFAQHDIPLYGVNENPAQADWTSSPKAHADIYIDDRAFGCPLRRAENGRLVVDWDVVGPAVLEQLEALKAG